MAKLNHTAGVEQVPCHSCSTSAEAISLLSMSLQTAIRAARYIRIPLPDIAPASESLRLRAVPKEEVPEEFRKICEQFGYNLVDVNSAVDMPQPNAEATHQSPVSPPAPQLPSSQYSDAISIHSSSTDWEEEYGVTANPPSSDVTDVPSSDATMIPSSDPSAAPSPILPLPSNATAENKERWYAVIVGRNPGVFCGSHAVSSNVSEVPGGFARRFGTQELAQAAYDQALDAGQVIEVTYTISKRPLSRPAA